ncbi:MAG: hypothetical protein JXB49_12560 [Bacteroidales bacterium]|nr:hypothetical protein [Bacteroidales bacterium]
MSENPLITRTKKAHKTYTFIDIGNPRVISEYWFQETHEGKLLFLVFYTQACRYSLCAGCNLPSKMSQNHIDYRNIMRQIDSVFYNILSETEKQEIKKIIISNNGSILDEDTFSTTALLYLIAKINMECPHVETVTLETRPEYVDLAELEVLARALREGYSPSALELAIGVEAFDDHIRNDVFNKGLEIRKLHELAQDIAITNKKHIEKEIDNFKKIRLKTYFMLKPVPGLTDEEAINDIKRGIDLLDELAKKYDIEINMHLNPTYVSRGTVLEKEFLKGNYTPPTLASTREAVLHAKDKNITLYVGLSDEGLAVDGGSFLRPDDPDEMKLFEKFEKFNATQNFQFLL